MDSIWSSLPVELSHTIFELLPGYLRVDLGVFVRRPLAVKASRKVRSMAVPITTRMEKPSSPSRRLTTREA